MDKDIKAHVKRVHKMERNPDFPPDDEENPERMFEDVWVDVLRLDKLFVRLQSEHITPKVIEGQRIQYVFKWNDDIREPDPDIEINEDTTDKVQWENANPIRKTKKLLIKDPDVKAPAKGQPKHNVDDNSVSLWIVEKVRVDEPRGKTPTNRGQKVQYVFKNEIPDKDDESPRTRETTPIEVVNNDLNGLKMMTEEKNEDGVREALIIDWEKYLEALKDGDTDEDDDLVLTVEVVDNFRVRFQSDPKTGQKGQLRNVVLASKQSDRHRRYEQVEDNFEEGDRDAEDAYGNPALVRLDPLQVIVNVGSNIIAVEFAPGGGGAGGASEEPSGGGEGGPSLPGEG
jgi:hypothetical protein